MSDYEIVAVEVFAKEYAFYHNLQLITVKAKDIDGTPVYRQLCFHKLSTFENLCECLRDIGDNNSVETEYEYVLENGSIDIDLNNGFHIKANVDQSILETDGREVEMKTIIER